MKKKNLLVTIPAGIKTGDRMKVGGEGEAGFNGGTPGDLYISINVKPHVLFSTENNNLKITVPVDAITAMVGGEVMVPSLQGKLVLKIPTSTQNGKILIIKSGGIKNASSKRIGDLFCEIKIITPTSLSSTQRANLYEVLETIDVPSLPNISSWNDKVEEFENELKG
jgi:molecular chaperone DnaJ